MFFSPDSEVLPEQADGDPTGPDDVRVLQTARGEDLISFILVQPLCLKKLSFQLTEVQL